MAPVEWLNALFEGASTAGTEHILAVLGNNSTLLLIGLQRNFVVMLSVHKMLLSKLRVTVKSKINKTIFCYLSGQSHEYFITTKFYSFIHFL